jgi:hypothetical protein
MPATICINNKSKRRLSVNKLPYVCGPLTELAPEEQAGAKKFYVRIADACERAIGTRAFVPHEHYDPDLHANFGPEDVDYAERLQVCEHTSVLIVLPIAPSWGGGIEVEMAYRSGVPVILLCNEQKLAARKISRLLRGNPGVVSTTLYSSEEDALMWLEATLPVFVKDLVTDTP